MNLDTEAPEKTSRSPTPSFTHSNSPIPPPELTSSSSSGRGGGGGGSDHLYQNINKQPLHKGGNSRTDVPDIAPPEANEAPARVPPPASRRPMAKLRGVVGGGGGGGNVPLTTTDGSAHKEDVLEKPPQQPMPKPRPRKQVKHEGEETAFASVNHPTPNAGGAGPFTNRPLTPTNPKPFKKQPETAPRTRSPDMSRRPLPSAPEKAPSPKHKSPDLPRHPPPVKPSSNGPPATPSPLKPPTHQSTPERAKLSLPTPVESEDSTYSLVDMSQITDTGPEIMVVDEKRNKSVPLKSIEENSKGVSKDGSSKNNSSIMDTVREIVGEGGRS